MINFEIKCEETYLDLIFNGFLMQQEAKLSLG